MSFASPISLSESKDSSKSSPSSQRILALDGLRALAVIAVMAFHSEFGLSGGFLGVDIFFVLSGFLITQILLSITNRSIRFPQLSSFWLARARRLFPALFLVILAVACWRYFYADVEQLNSWKADIVAAATFSTNWLEIIRSNDYFAETQGVSPLLQTWSLSIEEQYYLLFPFLLVLILRMPGLRRHIPATLAVLGICSAAWMAILALGGAEQSRVYYGTDTRAQALLLGSALGAWIWQRRAGQGHSFSWSHVPANWQRPMMWAGRLGLAGLVVLLFTANVAADATFSGIVLLTCVLTAALILSLSSNVDPLLSRLFSLRWVVAVGTISYGLYLWHWPVFLLVNDDTLYLPIPLMVGVQFGLSGLLAYLSYRFVESPVRFGRLRAARPRTQWALAFACFALLIASALLTPVRASFAVPLPIGQFDEAKLPKRVLLSGDSVALALGNNTEVPKANGMVIKPSAWVGCGILANVFQVDGKPKNTIGDCTNRLDQTKVHMQAAQPNASVLQLSRFDIIDQYIGNELAPIGSPAYIALLKKNLTSMIDVLGVDGQLPVYVTNIPCMRAYGISPPETNDHARQEQFNTLLAAELANYPNVYPVNIRERVCPLGSYTGKLDGENLYRDGIHPNAFGSAIIWDTILAEMQRTYPEFVSRRTAAESPKSPTARPS